MSKNTGTSVFRKVNIDEFDENNFKDDEVVDEVAAGPDKASIQQLLNSKKNTEALQLVLKNPPVSSDAEVKDRVFELVLNVLTAFKASEVGAAVDTLDNDAIDILMKYIYKGFSQPSDATCPALLTWHEKVYASGGVGSIIRVLTDRKGV